MRRKTRAILLKSLFKIPRPAFRRAARSEALLSWKESAEARRPLLGVERAELKSKVAALSAADTRLRDLSREILTRSARAEKIGPQDRWVEITRLTGKRTLSLRQFIKEGAPLGLFEFRPVWLMNPDTASRVLPLAPGLFDLAIYDEASQMPVEYAVPTLYRAKSLVVSGDDKQMPPSGFFSAALPEDEWEDGGGELMGDGGPELEIRDCPDMLQLARRTLPKARLQIHYRSAYKELIAFSNAAFYQGQLHVAARRPESRVLSDKPIRYLAAGGAYKGQTNLQEARAVIGVLWELWSSPVRPTVGVVTFNLKQQALISSLVDERAQGDQAFKSALAEESARIEDGEDMGFFIKNVENVQGDERDVIVFSSTFGRDETGRFSRNFGALGHNGGERRLNVAITRAKERVILVSSMPIGDISDMLSTRRPPSAPRDYLQIYWAYAEALSRGAIAEAELILGRAAPAEGHGSEGAKFGPREAHPIRAAVKESLARAGWEAADGDMGGVFGLDLLLEDKRRWSYFLGI